MRIIANGNEGYIKLWYTQEKSDATYRLMRYVLKDVCDEGTLLLNVVTGELVLLSEEETELLNMLPASYTPRLDEFIHHRFVVPVLFDEVKSVDQLRLLLKKLNARDEITSYSILPTTACNARCFYCFESEFPRQTMTLEMADKVVDYMLQHCGEKRVLSLKWFGGEPTLGAKQIDRICERLTQAGVDYTSSMISNAYLFTRDMAQKAKEKWHLTFIQITLDGTERVYNQTKAYINPQDNPFYRVLDNITYLSQVGITVSIRLNVDFHNVVDISALVDELAERFSGNNQISAYAAALFENEGFTPIKHSKQDQLELIQKVVEINHRIIQKGLEKSVRHSVKAQLPSLKVHYCMSDNDCSLQVNPLGEFSKCEHAVFDQFVGSVEDGHDFSNGNGWRWLHPEYVITCKKCVLYPDCGQINTCDANTLCREEQIKERIEDIRRQVQYRYKSRALNDEEGSVNATTGN